MKRLRQLSAHPSDGKKLEDSYTLVSLFFPSEASDSLDEEKCGMRITADLHYSLLPGPYEPGITVTLVDDFLFPDISLVKEEMDYFLELLKTLMPYETSSRTPPQSPDFKEIPD